MRKTLFFVPLFALCLSPFANGGEPAAAPKPKLFSSRYVIGTSASSANASVLQPGIDLVRITGGEYVSLGFLTANLDGMRQTVAGVKITAYSKSGKGAVMVHGVRLSPANDSTELKELAGMLAPNKSVKVLFPSPVSESELVFQLEGFGSDDASVAIDLFFTQAGTYKYRATEDYVNPPESGGDGGGGGGGDPSYRDQCFSSPGHFGCSDRGPGSLYDQSGCEATPGSFNCQGG